MDYVKINGKSYDVIVAAVTESFNILNSEEAGRTIAPGAPMVLAPLGTFYGHHITFRRKAGCEREYDELYDFVSKPRYDGIDVEIVHNQTTIAYEAYVSTGQRALQRIGKDGKVYWGEFALNITPMEAQVIPE